MIHTDAGYYALVPPPSGAGNPSYSHVWYLKDHLGNNRILADGSGNLVAAHFYDPFGNGMTSPITGLQPAFPAGTTASPYKYGGKEWNTTSSTYDFEARQMAPGFHRFTTMDPLCEKYYSISPYAYCANNPVNMVDPDGLLFDDYYSSINGKYLGSDAYGYSARLITPQQFSKITKEHALNRSLSVTKELRDNSRVISIDSQMIEKNAQSVADDSRADRLEHQNFIVLDRETASITSVVGKTGTNNHSEIEYYPGKATGVSFYDKPGGPIIIGQIHGHPQSNQINQETQKTMSSLDINTAQSLQIPIYGVDAMSGDKGDSMSVHVALPSGGVIHNVRKTAGVSGNTSYISWGVHALQIWGKSMYPLYE